MANLAAENHSIESHADLELSPSTGSQRDLAIAAPKALDSISQDEGACRSTPLDVVDKQATHEEIVTGAQNYKQHCFGDQHSFSRAETSTRLDRNRDRTNGGDHDGQDVGAAAGNIYAIFAEKIFATSGKYGGTEREGQGRAKRQANDVILRALSRSRSGSPSSGSTGSNVSIVVDDDSGYNSATPPSINPQGSVIGRHDLLVPVGVAPSSAPLPTQRPVKQPLESHPATLDSGRKRIRTSCPVVPFTIDADRETRTRTLVPISLSDGDSINDSNDETLDPVASSQQRGPPPVIPEDNQYLVERLLKRQGMSKEGNVENTKRTFLTSY
ncbi:hypothetical protein B0J12DRAFT_733310 [Macrophomina phaseolina]|uniref:Uncharacterized protein n=1 Tax=Macrophomina phaseolina TaxID=35725 RepID=A0ABQ8FSB1_9PEZI|nr:hypothetical protein B0J12DRAFT_733310 [Macrophomina phaseolina]